MKYASLHTNCVKRKNEEGRTPAALSFDMIPELLTKKKMNVRLSRSDQIFISIKEAPFGGGGHIFYLFIIFFSANFDKLYLIP